MRFNNGAVWSGALRAGIVSALLAGMTSPVSAEGLLMLVNPAVPPGPGLGLELTAGAYVGNDMVPARDLDAEPWPTDYHARSGANLAVGSARFDVGGSERGWNMGYFYRRDWLLEAGKDTVDAYVLNQYGQVTSQVRTYDLDYSLRGFTADGVRVGYSAAVPFGPGRGLVWGVSVSLLHGREVREEKVRGELVSLAGSGTLNGDRRYYDSGLQAQATGGGFDDFIPPEAMDVPSGWGFGLDLGVTWYGPEGATLALVVNDLAGMIRWDRVPLIEQQVNHLSDPFEPGGSGAAVTGRNVYDSLTLRLKPKVMVRGEYPIGRFAVTAGVEGIAGNWFPRIGASYAMVPDLRAGIGYETRFGGVELYLSHRNYYLSLAAQGLDPAESRVLGMTAGWRRSF